jgi:dihydroorotate dehydrogenase electron transfer subunit
VRGKGTGLLKNYFSGEEISILGPLGRGFSYENNGRKKIIVAGGVGLAPFPFLIEEMILKAKIKPKDIIIVYGARRKEFLVGLERLRKFGLVIYLSTDSGEKGFKGTVTDLMVFLLRKNKIERGDYYSCGPEKMMKRVVTLAGESDSRVQVCLEERMGCGVGACLSCVRKISGHYLRICQDGPIFWGDEVEWE